MNWATPLVIETASDRPSSSANSGGSQVKCFIAKHGGGLRLPSAEFYRNSKTITAHTRLEKPTMAAVGDYFRAGLAAGHRPIALGGDHRITLHILRAAFSKTGLAGLVILDAHTDCQGMDEPLTNYNVLGKIREEFPGLKMILLGARDVDVDIVRRRHIFDLLLDADECREGGVRGTVERVLGVMGMNRFYLSIDLDVLDPLLFPCVAAPVSGGLQPADLFGLINGFGDAVIAADIVEFVATDALPVHHLLIADLFFQLSRER